MSLPPSYTSTREYLIDAIKFMETYSWIYRESNTQYIKANILTEIPKSWIHHISLLSNEQFNQLPFGFINSEWPADLKHFFLKISQLKPQYTSNEQFKLTVDRRRNNSKGINPKKLHEISNLSKMILEIGQMQNVHHYIDVGSGLGYLTQYLYENNDSVQIYGIESDIERVCTAQARQAKYYKNSMGKVNFTQHFVDSKSHEYFEKIIDETGNSDYGLIGMHACGDLTINSLKLFHQIERIKLIIIMPCCYHKMSLTDEGKFINIPLSNTLKDVLSTINSNLVINRPFLRLASQQSSLKWKSQTQEEHRTHGRNMFERAIVECCFGEKENLIKIDKSITTGDITFASISRRYRIMNQANEVCQWNETHKTKIEDTLTMCGVDGVVQSEILTCLQTCLQTICENIVLLDRIGYMNEIAPNIEFYTNKIVSDDLSPRCYALVGLKH